MERQDLFANDLTDERLPSPEQREETAHDFKLDPDDSSENTDRPSDAPKSDVEKIRLSDPS